LHNKQSLSNTKHHEAKIFRISRTKKEMSVVSTAQFFERLGVTLFTLFIVSEGRKVTKHNPRFLRDFEATLMT
jgi:hypothetical protein